ncbi:hypothetical protein [uncultured Psychroserpens sp.]|uniref:hypothetical protein n=1 Tax=uncultured Psychroserpens sp. TaxID=255436 RepID=UPI00261E6E79|nr:hypothetical protein [uncultured Psychroserpens sp.]
MRQHHYISILFIFVGLSCDEAKELFEEEFDVETTFVTELEVNVPNDASQDAVEFQSNTGLWDFRNDPNVAEFLGSPDEITKIQITSVRYFYKDVVGNDDAFVEGEIVVAVGQGTDEFDTVVTNLRQADENNTLYTLEGDFSNVNAALTLFDVMAFYYSGSVSDNPVRFVTDVSITAIVTIKPNLDNL